MKKWAYSLHTFTQVLQDLQNMRQKNENKEKLVDKEEGNGRINADTMMIHTLRPEQLNLELVDIDSGKVSRDSAVNVDDAVYIGTLQMEEFLKDLPQVFIQPYLRRCK